MRRIAVLGTGSTLVFLVCVSLLRAEPAAAMRLTVQPAHLELHGSRDRQRLLVTAVAPDGSVKDVTGSARFESDHPAQVTVSAAGECIAHADGQALVTIHVGGASATVPVSAHAAKQPQPPSFVNDVIPLLTRLGCNQGACHGKGAGQNGFRLSLRGYAPEWDHDWLTREFNGRRINRAVPEESLVLQKPLGLVPHEGGKLFDRDSRAYHMLLDWIRAGAPGPLKDEVTVRRLEVLPGNRTLRVGQEQALLVRAQYSDGQWRDVTWLTRFDSNDAGLAEVDAHGLVRIRRQGETAVRASFQGEVAVVLLTVPHDRPVRPELLAQRNNLIDEHLFNKLAALRIEPSGPCDDASFIRRAFLDTIGTLPAPAEVRAFLADRRSDKRTRLIDALLERPEFVDYWALQLGDLLQNRKERDHDVRGVKGVRAFHEWLRQKIAANTPWDQLAREVLTATGKSTEHPAVGYFIVTVGEEREAQRSEVVAAAAQAFLGTRIGCAKCHNHPLERYTQDDYYHFAAYFARLRLERKEPATTLLVAAPDGKQTKEPIGIVQPRTGAFLKPQPLDRSPTTMAPDEDPRIKLAAWITAPKNDSFSGAMVNRLWQHFFNVGLVEPVDDLRASNPPTNPELWQALTREFVAHQFDLKHMMRLMLNSRAYQLSSATNGANEQDRRFYSHYYTRRLPAEVLLDVLSQCTGVPDTFAGYPVGLRAVQVPDPSLKSHFLTLFGRSDRVTACACERNGEVTMPQLLHLLNGDSVVQKIRASQGRLAGLLKSGKDDAQLVDELFLQALSRSPTAKEWAAIKGELAQAESRDNFYRDLFWALVNTKEFSFSH